MTHKGLTKKVVKSRKAKEIDNAMDKFCNTSVSCQPSQPKPQEGHIKLRCATWIKPLVDPVKRRDAVIRTRTRLCDLPPFDAIAFTGLSGSVIAGAVALAMDKYLYCVRKNGESRHSEYQVEGPSTGLRYAIIDDFISTGATIERIIEMVSAHTNGTAVCVGAYLWRDDELKTDLLRYTSRLPRHKKPA